MRQLFPVNRDNLDVEELYRGGRPPRPKRPYVAVNMVTSIDGATAVEGVTAKLGSPGDKRIFFLLRSLADVILVGAQTVRAEGYGPPRLDRTAVAARLARGQSSLPAIAVVSRSLNFDWSSSLFTDPATRPVILTPASAQAEELRRAQGRADVVIVGDTSVDLAQGLEALSARGARLVLCEGGPTLNGELASAGVVDELCLTVAPTVVGGGGAARLMGARPLKRMLDAALLHMLEEDGFLFLRYGLAQGTEDER